VLPALASVVLGCVVSVGAASPASAAETIWAKRQISVENQADYGAEVAEALGQWNLLPGTSVKFVPVPSGRRADVVITTVSGGRDWLGRTRSQVVTDARGRRRTVSAVVELNSRNLDEESSTAERIDVLAHELGHVLTGGTPDGSHSSEGCSVMRPTGFPECEDEPPDGLIRCGPQAHDYAALIRLYGGTPSTFEGYFCRFDEDDD